MEKHYFAVDAFGWATDEDMDTAILKRINDTGKVCLIEVWEVPVSEKTHYKVNYYAPLVVGAKKIRTIEPKELKEDDIQVVTISDVERLGS